MKKPPKGEEARMIDPLFPGSERTGYEVAVAIFILAAYGALVLYVLLIAPPVPTDQDARVLAAWKLLFFLVPILLAWISNLLAARHSPRR
jgi:hypothetical protein